MRFLAPETAQARTRQILEDAKRAKEEEQRALEAVQNFRPPDETQSGEEKEHDGDQKIDDTTEMPVVEKVEDSQVPEKNPVPISVDEKNPAPISTFSESPTIEEAEKNNIKVIISDILDTFSDEKLAELCEKYTKNDKRWKRTRQLEELLKADLTLDQLYS
jgi:hypothetical protein